MLTNSISTEILKVFSMASVSDYCVSAPSSQWLVRTKGCQNFTRFAEFGGKSLRRQSGRSRQRSKGCHPADHVVDEAYPQLG